MLSRVRTVIIGVWIDSWIYWTLLQLVLRFIDHYYTQTSVLSHSGFQRRTFFCQPHTLTADFSWYFLQLLAHRLKWTGFQLPTSKFSCQRSVKVKVTLRLAVYLQSVHLGAKPLETPGITLWGLGADATENTASNSSIVAWIPVAMGT
jgi:hypothetical protein